MNQQFQIKSLVAFSCFRVFQHSNTFPDTFDNVAVFVGRLVAVIFIQRKIDVVPDVIFFIPAVRLDVVSVGRCKSQALPVEQFVNFSERAFVEILLREFAHHAVPGFAPIEIGAQADLC